MSVHLRGLDLAGRPSERRDWPTPDIRDNETGPSDISRARLGSQGSCVPKGRVCDGANSSRLFDAQRLHVHLLPARSSRAVQSFEIYLFDYATRTPQLQQQTLLVST